MLGRLQRLPEPIRIVIIGIGSMGKGLLRQSLNTPGIRTVAVADIDITRAIAAAEAFGCAYRIVETRSDLARTIRAGLLAICADGDLLARCDLTDVVVEASSSIIAALQFALAALEHRKHLVLMNSEIDLTFGPFLLQLAREYGVTYTSCDGDQHGAIKHLIDESRLWGFDLMMAGNIKGFLDRYTDPVKIAPEADLRDLDHRMCSAYTDGSKLAIEMALVANACGLRTMTPGMRGPRAEDVGDVLALFDFDAIATDGPAVVDYVLGARPHGGVFVVGRCDDTYQQGMLKYYKMGPGPFYVFYRPYHLCHIESIRCIAEAFLDGQSCLQPDHGLVTNVIAYAKRPLGRGARLDGLGGFACYGLIENRPSDGLAEGLPLCLADDVVLDRDIAQDERISMADVRADADRIDFQVFRRSIGVPALT